MSPATSDKASDIPPRRFQSGKISKVPFLRSIAYSATSFGDRMVPGMRLPEREICGMGVAIPPPSRNGIVRRPDAFTMSPSGSWETTLEDTAGVRARDAFWVAVATRGDDGCNAYVERLEHGHTLQEGLVLLPLLEGALEDDAPEGLPVLKKKREPGRTASLRHHARTNIKRSVVLCH